MAMGRAAKGHGHGTSLPWQLTQLEAQGNHSTSLLQSTESTDCHHDPVFTRIQIGRSWVRCDSWCQLGEAAAEAMHLSLTPQLTSLGDCADWAKLWQQDSLSQHPVEHLHEMNLYQNVLKCQYQARVTFEACSWAKVLERALHSSASRALCDALWRTSRSSCFFPWNNLQTLRYVLKLCAGLLPLPQVWISFRKCNSGIRPQFSPGMGRTSQGGAIEHNGKPCCSCTSC